MNNFELIISYTLKIGVSLSALLFLIGLFLPHHYLKHLGIYVLLATPFLRVALSIIFFALQKNRLYVMITSIVLINLIIAFFLLKII